MAVRKILECSPCHLPPQFLEHLINTPLPEWMVTGYWGGWQTFVLYAHDEVATSLPPEVLAIFAYARRLGCDYVVFNDELGVKLPGFPVYDYDGPKSWYGAGGEWK